MDNGARTYNSLPRKIKSATDLDMFKSLAKRHLSMYLPSKFRNFSVHSEIMSGRYFPLFKCHTLRRETCYPFHLIFVNSQNIEEEGT